MKNPATNPETGGFNAFTRFLREMLSAERTPLVLLRDGRIIPLQWYDAEGPEYAGFRYIHEPSNTHMCWDNDGTSITSRDFDMMETV